MTPSPHPLQVGGATVLLAGRRPNGDALVCYADKGGNPTSGFRIVRSFELRGLGWHMAAIKAAIARLPEARFAFDETRLPQPAPAPPRCLLFAHHAAAASERED